MIIELQSVSKIYNKGKPNAVHALTGIDLKIRQGDSCAIIGASGSGKSTLLNIIGCLDKPTYGTSMVIGVNTSEATDRSLAQLRNAKIGFVLQDFGLIEDRSVYDNVCTPLYFSKVRHSSWPRLAREALEKVGLSSLIKRPVSQLSGGQKQRVAIARALICDPELILADEPTGALDTGNSHIIMDIFSELNRAGKTLLIVTHDPVVAACCQKIYELSDGQFIV